VDIDDMESMTRRTESLMNDPARAEATGRRGREWVLERYSIEREAEGIRQVYERLWANTKA